MIAPLHRELWYVRNHMSCSKAIKNGMDKKSSKAKVLNPMKPFIWIGSLIKLQVKTSTRFYAE